MRTKWVIALCATFLLIGSIAGGEGQGPKNREVTPAEALANIRDSIIQLNMLSAPSTPAFPPTTTTTMPPGRKPSGLLSYIGQPAQKLFEGIYSFLPYLETDEYRVKEVRWTVGSSTNVEITMERRVIK